MTAAKPAQTRLCARYILPKKKLEPGSKPEHQMEAADASAVALRAAFRVKVFQTFPNMYDQMALWAWLKTKGLSGELLELSPDFLKKISEGDAFDRMVTAFRKEQGVAA